MASSSPAPSIFKSDAAVEAVITLVLIENSQEMVPAWGNLRGQYLPTLLGCMRAANPVVPIPILWLTTTPVGGDSSLQSAPPRQYNQLPDLKFSFQPGNRVSARIINRSIELMLEAAGRFPNGLVALHLIIVAASPPLEGTWNTSPTFPTHVGKSEWQLVAEKLAQNKVFCHMVLPSSQNMGSLEQLFMANMQLQNHQSVQPWFTPSAGYSFYLSASRPARPRQMSAIIPGVEPSVDKNLTSPSRPPVHRHQTFPGEVMRSSSDAAPTPQSVTSPSLVSSLQKIHGLSRKKVYGAQTPRQPFCREEPVRAKYRQAPTPLSIPVGSEDKPGSNKGSVGRIRSPERASSPSDPISPTRRSPRHVRGMSPCDMKTTPTLTAPLSTPHGAPPVTSAHPDSPVYMTMASPSSSIPPVSVASHTLVDYPGSGSTLMTPLTCVPSQEPSSSTSTPAWNATPRFADAGDVPFLFSPELEAATAAKLQAALQCSSFSQPLCMPGNHYAADGTAAVFHNSMCHQQQA
ncbi:hypothetical protein EDC04DRAFT_672516 [Pisolithus marmoratus]|nr:hypothetical protein EDC04DRAFT_672516 [Pisolithus marmoratus]